MATKSSTVQAGIKALAEGRTTVEAVQAAVAKADEPAAKGTKECGGVPKLGIARHTTSTSAFTAKASRPDGLSRRCKECQSADRKARRAAKATSSPVAAPGAKAKAKPATATAKAKRTAKPAAKPVPTPAAK